MFCVNDHVGIAIAGLTSDVPVLRRVPPTSHKIIKARREERKRERRPAHRPSISLYCAAISCASTMVSKMVFNRLVSAIANSASCPASSSTLLPSIPAANLTHRI